MAVEMRLLDGCTAWSVSKKGGCAGRRDRKNKARNRKEVKETCLRKDVFEHNMLRLENKMDALTKFLMERRD